MRGVANVEDIEDSLERVQAMLKDAKRALKYGINQNEKFPFKTIRQAHQYVEKLEKCEQVYINLCKEDDEYFEAIMNRKLLGGDEVAIEKLKQLSKYGSHYVDIFHLPKTH